MTSSSPLRIAVLSASDNTALAALPKLPGQPVEFIVTSDLEGCKQLQDISALVIIPPFNQDIIDQVWDEVFPNVRWVHTFSAGVDFVAELTKRRLLNRPDILFTNGRGAFSSSLAEYIMASAMHFNKQICRLQKNRAEKKWEKFTMSTLKGKRMGFIGYGDIAKSAAVIAKTAFGMKIAVYRRNASKFAAEEGAAIVDDICESSEDVFSSSDFVVCTLPGTVATANFCSSQFSLMKPNAVFISCGRGAAVDEASLYAALCQPDGIHAALDVFAMEPLPPDSLLWTVPDDRILISSHNADLTDDYFVLGWNIFENNLARFLIGEGMATPVDREHGY